MTRFPGGPRSRAAIVTLVALLGVSACSGAASLAPAGTAVPLVSPTTAPTKAPTPVPTSCAHARAHARPHARADAGAHARTDPRADPDPGPGRLHPGRPRGTDPPLGGGRRKSLRDGRDDEQGRGDLHDPCDGARPARGRERRRPDQRRARRCDADPGARPGRRRRARTSRRATTATRPRRRNR